MRAAIVAPTQASTGTSMPTIVNPMDALKGFEPALKQGELVLQRGDIHPDVLVHLDHPNGETRVTYVTLRGDTVESLAIIIPAEPLNGKPVFQIGYAVPQHLRKRGLAKTIAQAAINEFKAGMARSGVKSFYLEAMVSRKNAASQKVAMTVIGGKPKETVDNNSGEPAYQYMTEINLD